MSPPRECVFCKIANGAIAARKVAEGEDWVAFDDVNPQAPVHLLLIPRRHIASLDAAGDGERGLLGGLLAACREAARARGLSSYRVVTNVGAEAGQSVFHLHLHVLGGRPMTWPPG